MAEKRILIVDDEVVWRKLLCRLFQGQGYAVLQAASCRTALEKLRSARVDCAIVDYNLPDGTGAVVCAAIREMDGGLKTPVIMFTADRAAAEYMFGPHRADMLVFKDRPVLALPGLMASLF
ncbi:MAG: response regulator [Elusimicrobiales bacterium]|nr:response regulator [Elusimicrobiales bacterium]